MQRILFIVLLLAVLNMGHTKDAELVILSLASTFYVGEDIRVICNIEKGDSEWIFSLKFNGHPVQSGPSYEFEVKNLTVSGEYQCVASEQGLTNHIKESNVVYITVSDIPKTFLMVNGDTVLRRRNNGPELTCCVNDSSNEWAYVWTIEGIEFNTIDDTQTIRASDVGKYTCKGIKFGFTKYSISSKDSDAVYIEREVPDMATVKVQESSEAVFFPGETIMMKCELDQLYDWSYEWRTTSQYILSAKRELIISSASEAHSGDYWCKGRYDLYFFTQWSPALTITVADYKPTVDLRASSAFITNRGHVFLSCSIDGPHVWQIFFFKYTSDFTESFKIRGGYLDSSSTTTVGSGGVYFCRGGRGDPLYFTESSNAVTIVHKANYNIRLTVQPDWLPLFSGEAVTVTCRVYNDFSEKWIYEWSRPNTDPEHTNNTLFIPNAAPANSGMYKCQAIDQQDPYFTTEWSNPITLVVFPNSPNANLSADARSLPAWGIVTLVCSVSPSSSGWEFYWYKDTQSTLLQTTEATVLSVSEGGRYWCRGGRGSPVYYTQFSEPISIQETDNTKLVTPDPSVTTGGEKSESISSFNLIIPVTCALILLILIPLIALGWYKKSRERQQNRNAETSLGAGAQNVTVDNQQQLYSSLLHGDASVYETIRGAMTNNGNDRVETF